jgi:hypothetical protein
MDMSRLKKEAGMARPWCYHTLQHAAKAMERIIISALTIQTGPDTFLHQCFGPLK